MDVQLNKRLSELGNKLDLVETATSWSGEQIVEQFAALASEEGPLIRELHAVYERLDTIARQLDDVIELLRKRDEAA